MTNRKKIDAYPFRAFSSMAVLALALAALAGCSDGGGSELRTPSPPSTSAESTPALVVDAPGAPSSGAAAGDTIDLRKIGYSRGSADAPVTVYEFSDFGCPFCAMFARGTYPALHDEFVETGKVRWTYVPFVMGMFPNGAESARAAECAAEQSKFWEMHDVLYMKQNEWQSSNRPQRLYDGYARELGLDVDSFSSCYREDRGGERTALNNRTADALRVRATPSFFINGRLIEGSLPADQFRQLLTTVAGEE